MAGNRYYANSTQEVLESFEWLFREKLEELDQMSRNMWRDLFYARVPSDQIQPIIQQFFAELWEQVAETEEQRLERGGRDGLESGDAPATCEHSLRRSRGTMGMPNCGRSRNEVPRAGSN